jgi:exosortase
VPAIKVQPLGVGNRLRGSRELVAIALLVRFLLAIGVTCWIVGDALGDIIHVAGTESEASHIWLVPFIFTWLFWLRARQVHLQLPSGGSWLGAIASFSGMAIWMIGYRLQIQFAWHFGAVMVIAGAALSVSGADYFWKFLPAWGTLVFAVPVPIRLRLLIAQPLEQLTAVATQFVSEILGMSVGRSGNQLSVNGVDVCIAEACNGLRLIFTLSLACYVALFIRRYRSWLRMVLLLLSPLVAVIANVARLVPTLWMYGHYPPAAAERFHDIGGAVMVLVAFAALTGLCELMQWVGLPVLSKENEADVQADRMRGQHSSGLPRSVAWKPLLLFFTALCIGAARRETLPNPDDASSYHHQVVEAAEAVGLTNGDWIGVDIPLPRASLDELKTNVAIARRYTNQKTGLSADVLVLQSPDVRDLYPHYPPVCYPGQGLKLIGSELVELNYRQMKIVARRYTFNRLDFRRADPTVVDNFMVVPIGETQPDTNGLERRIGTDRRYFGCAQVQVVYRQILSPQEQTEITQTLLRPYLPLLAVIECHAKASQ